MKELLKKSIKTVATIQPKDFEKAWGEKLSAYVSNKIEDAGFEYESLDKEGRDECLRRMMDVLMHASLEKAGEHRIEAWEKGWGENFSELSRSEIEEALIPKYFNKFSIVRWMGDLVRPVSQRFEYRMLSILQHWLFDKYLRNFRNVYEFGCGTGHNLFRVRDVNPEAELWGLDWATSSQSILKQLRERNVDAKIFGHRFNYFEPDTQFHIKPESAVVTVASLEQIGDRHENFIQYLLKEKPNLCIHIEPIHEVLDEKNLLDYLSIEYFKKRNYLKGFLTRLRALESENKLEILDTKRSQIGSFFIEGYTIIVWKPKF